MADQRTHYEEHGQSVLIGPGIEDSGLAVDELPEPGGAPPQVEGQRLMMRLVIAFCLAVVMAGVCFVLLPAKGIDIPPMIPLLGVAIIMVAALTTAKAEGQLPTKAERDAKQGQSGSGCSEGRAVGCCSGPRPPRFLREPRKPR